MLYYMKLAWPQIRERGGTSECVRSLAWRLNVGRMPATDGDDTATS